MNIHALELTRLPNVSLQLTLRLAKTLLRDRPTGDESNVRIDEAAADLEEQVEIVNAALVVRMLESGPEALASELAFDRAVDALWYALVKLLDVSQVYAHPGLSYLPAKVAEVIELDESRALADEAAKLVELVFGPLSVTEMVKAPMAEQVESTEMILRNIDQQKLRPRLAAIVGERLLDTIEACQLQYEAMVDLRFRRERGLSVNLRDLRRDLRWALVEYISAIQANYRRKHPETGTWVLARLQPILTLRQNAARIASEVELDQSLDDFVEFELGAGAGEDAGADEDTDEL